MTTPKKHHWWPICVSQFWKDAQGFTTRLSPNGDTLRLQPNKFGIIGHGHSIKLSRVPGEATVWDDNFENEFQRADENFPRVIKWLEELGREPSQKDRSIVGRFVAQSASEEMLDFLMEGLVSLCVRSPMTRNAVARMADYIRGRIPERERNALIALSLRGRQRQIVGALRTRGKFVVIYSPDREFIFGDGFFHNLVSPEVPSAPEIMAPVTPRISVLFARPPKYMVEPRLSTLVIAESEAKALNHAVQVYSKEMLFYRFDLPAIADEFRKGQHLQFRGLDSPISRLIHGIPGVPPRDASLDFLFRSTDRS